MVVVVPHNWVFLVLMNGYSSSLGALFVRIKDPCLQWGRDHINVWHTQKWKVLELGKESSGGPRLSICVRETCCLAYWVPLERALKGLSFQPWNSSSLYCLLPSATTHKGRCLSISIRRTQYMNILNKAHFLTAQRPFCFLFSSIAL